MQVTFIAQFVREFQINPRECVEELRELQEEVENGTSDITITVGGCEYRIIQSDEIDSIQQDELANDEYVLGCFNDWFLADILDVPCSVIQEMQKSEAFEAIGKWVIETDKLAELQEGYAHTDGYGHHFNHYDGTEYEIDNYYIFPLGD